MKKLRNKKIDLFLNILEKNSIKYTINSKNKILTITVLDAVNLTLKHKCVEIPSFTHFKKPVYITGTKESTLIINKFSRFDFLELNNINVTMHENIYCNTLYINSKENINIDKNLYVKNNCTFTAPFLQKLNYLTVIGTLDITKTNIHSIHTHLKVGKIKINPKITSFLEYSLNNKAVLKIPSLPIEIYKDRIKLKKYSNNLLTIDQYIDIKNEDDSYFKEHPNNLKYYKITKELQKNYFNHL